MPSVLLVRKHCLKCMHEEIEVGNDMGIRYAIVAMLDLCTIQSYIDEAVALMQLI